MRGRRRRGRGEPDSHLVGHSVDTPVATPHSNSLLHVIAYGHEPGDYHEGTNRPGGTCVHFSCDRADDGDSHSKALSNR